MKPNFRPLRHQNARVRRSGRARRSGQAMIETAMVLLTVLVPCTLGILQFGIVINATNTLTQIAREGGRYAAIHGAEGVGADAAIRTYITQAASATSIKPSDLTVVIAMVNNVSRVKGNPITVEITYPMKKKVFIGNFVPGVADLKDDYKAKSTFVLE